MNKIEHLTPRCTLASPNALLRAGAATRERARAMLMRSHACRDALLSAAASSRAVRLDLLGRVRGGVLVLAGLLALLAAPAALRRTVDGAAHEERRDPDRRRDDDDRHADDRAGHALA